MYVLFYSIVTVTQRSWILVINIIILSFWKIQEYYEHSEYSGTN